MAKEIDWAYIICRLQRVGKTVEQQAKAADVSPRQIHRYKGGESEPPYSVGSRLISLYRIAYPST